MTDRSLGRSTSAGAAGRSVLLVPVGSTEQHGPHLPLATDSIVAKAWAQALAATSDLDVLVAPVLPYGAAGEHQSFPGTLSIGTIALTQVIVELARSARHSFERVVFVSGHGGNAEALHAARGQLIEEGHDVDVLLPNVPGGDAHAGHTETSLLLHLAPTSVHLDRAEVGRPEPISELMGSLRTSGVEAVSANGVLGDPSGASAEDGRQIFERLVADGRAAARL